MVDVLSTTWNLFTNQSRSQEVFTQFDKDQFWSWNHPVEWEDQKSWRCQNAFAYFETILNECFNNWVSSWSG